jgi:oligopeptide transport system substrate-binding protein
MNGSVAVGRNSRLTLVGLAAALLIVVTSVVPTSGSGTTVRIAYTVGLETLDPARAPDVFTQAVAGMLFDQLYIPDYLARPVQVRPLAASGMPSVSPDGRGITIAIRPGIRFASHPAFGGRPREMTAEDFVYSMKRFMDPALRSPIVSLIAGKIEGLDDLGSRASAGKARFDYDEKVSGLMAVGRYTVRIRLTQPDPTFVYLLANPDLSIVPHEAVEADGDEFARRPTGSGPYVVREFKPGARLVLERNPDYRAMRWEDVATAGPNDPEWATALRGRRFPLPDRVELLNIPEATTRLLALERGEIDVAPAPAAAIENNELAPRLAKAGFKLVRAAAPILNWFSFNMRDPQIGGAAPANIALRRAIALAIDDDEYIRVLEDGAATKAEFWIPPGISGYDPSYRNPVRYDPATANALLDRFSYRKGRDGYRRRPDGSELALTFTVGTSSRQRQWSEFMKRSFERIGVRVKFDPVAGAEQVARVETCRFQIQNTGGWIFDWPDGSNLMLAFYGRANGSVGMACMQDQEFDTVYERLLITPLGPERVPLYRHLVERLNVLTPVRLVPVPDEIYLTAPTIRGLLVHPAPGPNYAPFPYLDVAAKAK